MSAALLRHLLYQSPSAPALEACTHRHRAGAARRCALV